MTLPRHWTTARLGELLISLETGSRPRGGVKGITDGVPSLGGEHLDAHGGFRLENIRFVPEEFARNQQRGWIRVGDILIVKDGATTGKVSFVGNNFPYSRALINEHVFRCQVATALSSKYVFYWLLSARGNQQILLDFRGAAQGGISQAFVNKVTIPIAPAKEQRRIVEAVESYLSRLDAAIASLKRAKKNLERYRNSVLKAAVEGRLVPTEAELARKEGRDYEPADKLLKRILKERRKRWEEAEWKKIVERAKQKAAKERRKKAGNPLKRGQKLAPEEWQDVPEAEYRRFLPKDDKWKQKYKEPDPPETDALPQLPEGWCWATVQQLGNVVTGTTPSTHHPEYYGGDIPFVKPTDLDTADSVVSARQYLTAAGAAQSRLIPSGSVLVTCIGATIGKTGLAKVRCATNQQINAVVAETPIRNTRYLYWFFVSPVGQQAVIRNASSTTLPILNKSRFERLPIPLPPLLEQTRIVEEVERQTSVESSMTIGVLAQEQRTQRLRQSILKWAFKGKLADPDPNDEPASELLKRIKAERDAVAAKPRRKRNTRKKQRGKA